MLAVPRLAAVCAASLLFCAVSPSHAADPSPTDFVRGLYEGPEIYNPLASDDNGAFLTGPALAAMKTNAAEQEESQGVGCIDFVLTVNAQDWDDDTVRRTLEVEGDADPITGEATVAATFKGFEFSGIPDEQQASTTVLYDLKSVDGAWKIADMAATDPETGGELWRLSKLCP